MYRSVAQLDSLSNLLATWFPSYFTRFALPEPSVQGRAVYALRLRAGGGGERRGVMVVGGTHFRELMNPDAITELAVDLFVSHVSGSDITYGNRTWSAAEIKLILETLDLWLVPCMNPDGREYVMTVDSLWRKNRRDNPGTPATASTSTATSTPSGASSRARRRARSAARSTAGPRPSASPRRATSATSSTRGEWTASSTCTPTRSSCSGRGGTRRRRPPIRQALHHAAVRNVCPIGVAGYQEYIPPRDLQRFQTVGSRIVSAISSVRGRAYTSEPSIALYPTTGTQSDYAYSRHIANSSLRKTYGFTFETGPWSGNVADSFHPADPTLIKRDAKAGIIALMQQCICAIELIGARFFSDRHRGSRAAPDPRRGARHD